MAHRARILGTNTLITAKPSADDPGKFVLSGGASNSLQWLDDPADPLYTCQGMQLDTFDEVAVLMSFMPRKSIDDAYNAYMKIRSAEIETDTNFSEIQAEIDLKGFVMMSKAKDDVLLQQIFHVIYDSVSAVGISRSTGKTTSKPIKGSMLHFLQSAGDFQLKPLSDDPPTIASFEGIYKNLQSRGFLAPAVQDIQPEDLTLRLTPVCNFFGLSRGLPLGRYYLENFIAINQLREKAAGKTVLEVGGSRTSQKDLRFDDAKEYFVNNVSSYVMDNTDSETMKMTEQEKPVDAHDANAYEAEGYDMILCFNTLEHCRNPWKVIENMWKWAKPGAIVAVQVPAMQMVHHTPIDCYRILPDGLQVMFEDAKFSDINVQTFGNLQTGIMSLLGHATSEAPDSVRDMNNEHAPVICCCVAKK